MSRRTYLRSRTGAYRTLAGIGLVTPKRAGRKVGRLVRAAGLGALAGRAHAARRRKRRR